MAIQPHAVDRLNQTPNTLSAIEDTASAIKIIKRI